MTDALRTIQLNPFDREAELDRLTIKCESLWTTLEAISADLHLIKHHTHHWYSIGEREAYDTADAALNHIAHIQKVTT